MCRGELVNRIGVRAGVRDGFALWAGPRRVADRYATDELRDFWLERPRVTVTQYAAQRAACMRVARTDAVRAWLLPGQAADILLGQGKAQSSSSEGRWRVAVQDLPIASRIVRTHIIGAVRISHQWRARTSTHAPGNLHHFTQPDLMATWDGRTGRTLR